MSSLPSMQGPSSCDVIVAGAGPVGLFLACELALRGCSVLLLEKTPDPDSPLKRLPLGMRGLSAPSIEALYRRGLLSELEIPKKLKNPFGGVGGHFAGIPFPQGNIDATQWPYRLPSSTELSLISEIGELESVLARRAHDLGVTILRGCAVSGVHQTADAVVVESQNRSFCAKWLVGCDGSRSIVRKTCDFEFPGTEPEFTGYSAHLELADPHKLSADRNPKATLEPTVKPTGMYFQAQPGYLSLLEFDGGAGHLAEPLTMERVQDALRRVSETDVTIKALRLGATWTDRARQAKTYRKGRVFLAGDAAHIHAPLGGQGLNLGLGDAMNLGWKLAAMIHRQAPEGLLDSYQAERHPLGLKILGWARAQVAIMRPDAASRALNVIVRDLIATRDGATYFAGKVCGVRTHCDLQGTHPFVGHSVPNFPLRAGPTIGELMCNGQGILLDFTNNAALKAHAGGFCSLMYVPGEAEERFALTAILIRPDGIVAWASEDDHQDMSKLQRSTAPWFTSLTSSTSTPVH